jgi:hypothetical protein
METKPKKRKLSRKAAGFVKDIVEGRPGVHAALANYDTTDYMTAAAIASENLKKPQIIDAIAEALPDDLLARRHLELLNKREVIRTPDGDELSDQPDTQAVKAALDMAYKLKGSYAPEKHAHGHFTISDEHREKAKTAIKQIFS